MAKLKKTAVYVKGMHCPSCEVLMEDKFKEDRNVKDVRADFKTQKVEIEYTGKIHTDVLDAKIRPYGYSIVTDKEIKREDDEEPFLNRFLNAGVIAIILFILYVILQDAKLIPNIQLGGNLNFLSVFLLGLVASTSTCMATSGALFMATVGKHSSKNFFSAISFNLGRIVSYGFFGFVAGLVGNVLITSLKIGPILTLMAAVFMVFLGLDMARIISLGSVIPTGLTKNIFEKLEHRLIKNPKKTAFLLGSITYLLPCGFTQTVQVYALGLANPLQSSLTMMVFVLGTVPALLFVGYMSSLTQSKWYPYFAKVIGVLVFVIGLSYFGNFLALYGIQINPLSVSTVANATAARQQNGYQEVNMTVNSYGYSPNVFTIKKGILTKWIINGKNVFGCQGYLVAPQLGIQKALSIGENIIEFTPQEEGTVNFSCSMGMYRGQFLVN